MSSEKSHLFIKTNLSVWAFVLIEMVSVSAFSGQTTRIWEETIVLPTYEVAPPDPNPRFYSGRTYQGAKATFYPYPVSDQMTETKKDLPYKAVFLENDYIQISVLPELGGRIFSAVDKGNHYNFFYRQHVIKPALIGMLGAWISGGVEWNVPHHHRASSFMPVDYVMKSGPDGAKTIWVGETELRHRMKWMVGMTLRPDRSYIEMTVKLFNRTPEAQSFLFWINPAVHANTNYQVLFPPSTEWAVQHAKPEFASWPVANQMYGGTDYTRGVDISWWKNHTSPVSFFAWNCQDDFFGGYDHGRKAGVAQISNHHVSPGKKFFEWGNGSEGEMWTRILSDQDGPYLELMAGSYSDNQPDYSWVQPHEVKTFTHFWYPIRELGGLKNANTDAALNFEVSNHVAQIACNTTKEFPSARILLKCGDQVLLNQSTKIGPNKPYAAEVQVPNDCSTEKMRISIETNGRELIAYQPAEQARSPMPKPVQRPIPPKDIPSAEELYFTGLRIEQLYSPSFDPLPYYLEALRRDPGDYRANTALGALYCREGRFRDAEPLLRAAIERSTNNYIRPKDCEAQYYLGMAMKAQSRNEEAWDCLYRSIWDRAWQSPGYCALAEIACAKHNFVEALALVEKSLESGSSNTKALELKTSLLRKLNRFDEAASSANEILNIDPLNARALNERNLCARAQKKNTRTENAALSKSLRGEVTSYLEMATDYANCGMWDEAAAVLEFHLASSSDKLKVNPLVYYHLAYFRAQAGQREASSNALELAAKSLPDYCFPFQQETEPILLHAMREKSNDARAPYYLGNLLFDHQPLRAIELWETAVRCDPQFAFAQRNLGLARAQIQKDTAGAIDCLEKAAQLRPHDPRLLYELDVVYESAGTAVRERFDGLQKHREIALKRDDSAARLVAVLVAMDEPDEAVKILKERHFHNWEGSSGLHDLWVDACVGKGLKQLCGGENTAALNSFASALEYPVNQEVGQGRREHRSAQIYYCTGLAYEKGQQLAQAQSAYRKSADSKEPVANEGQFFKGLALRKTGKSDAAEKLFAELRDHGLAELEKRTEGVDYFAKFGEKRNERARLAQGHYLAGLGALGLGNRTEAEEQFKAALTTYPAHLGALNCTRNNFRDN